jgi:peptidoglycan hydrolase CwlO-like protein
MDPVVIISIVLALITIAVSITVFFASTHAARIQAEETRRNAREAVDAAAYERAKKIYESAIAQLEAEVARMRAQVREFEAETTHLQLQISSLRRTNAEIQDQLDKVNKRIDSTS